MPHSHLPVVPVAPILNLDARPPLGTHPVPSVLDAGDVRLLTVGGEQVDAQEPVALPAQAAMASKTAKAGRRATGDVLGMGASWRSMVNDA